MSSKTVEGKVVVVTGAGGGIGRDIALALAREGAKVVVNDIGASVSGEGSNAGPAQQVVNEIKAMGGEAAANTDSVADAVSAGRIIQTALDSFGRIDGVVNNAGILRDRFFHKMSLDEWDAVIKVHLYGAYYVSRAAANHFKEQESGAYVHMTSTSGLVGNFGQANYSAAKLGITALSKSIALDMHKFKVRSNCIAPFAWSRMIGSIPTTTPAEQARVDRMKQMTPAKIAPLGWHLQLLAPLDQLVGLAPVLQGLPVHAQNRRRAGHVTARFIQAPRDIAAFEFLPVGAKIIGIGYVQIVPATRFDRRVL